MTRAHAPDGKYFRADVIPDERPDILCAEGAVGRFEHSCGFTAVPFEYRCVYRCGVAEPLFDVLFQPAAAVKLVHGAGSGGDAVGIVRFAAEAERVNFQLS